AARRGRAARADGHPARAGAGVEARAGALARYAGYGPGDGNIQGFARQSFAYEVLQTLARGVDTDGIRIPAMPVEMARAFPPERLALLSAPALRMDHAADSITAFDQPADVAGPARDAGPASVGRASLDFGEAIWNPAHSSNYSTAGNARSAVIMHTIEG